jgi:glycine oxidase
MSNPVVDHLILGGGVVGLSLAYELACAGAKVCVIDRGPLGAEASWAGAGILPPAIESAAATSHDRLFALANRLHAQWSERLREETGIDNGYRVCGGVYLARGQRDTAGLHAAARAWKTGGIRVEPIADLAAFGVDPRTPIGPIASCFLPAEAQLRNPRHLRALAAGCAKRGVELREGVEAHDFIVRDRRIESVRTSAGAIVAANVCIAGGAWSAALLARLGCSLAVKPIRGQIVLLEGEPGRLRSIINEGPRYIVPRSDGRVLVGSTEDDVGFDRRPTAEGVGGLLAFALELMPSLAAARMERCWAGLRPGSADGLPYIGRVPGIDNAVVAAGHFRNGLQLSTATAAVVSQLLAGRTPEIDLTPFRVDRPTAAMAVRHS